MPDSSGVPFVVAAFVVTWTVLLLYGFHVTRRARRARRILTDATSAGSSV